MQVGDLVRTIGFLSRTGLLLSTDGGYHPAMVLWFGSGKIGCIPSNRLEVV